MSPSPLPSLSSMVPSTGSTDESASSPSPTHDHGSDDSYLDIRTLPAVAPLKRDLQNMLQRAIDDKTKPPGSLGQIESLALQIGLIQRTATPSISRATMLIFAGDHGVVRQGVSPYPQAVTAQMVANFIAGGAAINVFSAGAGLSLEIINAGVASDLPDAPNLINTPVGLGTRDYSEAPAMSDDEVHRSMALGAARVAHHAALGSNTIGFGEMGIGNTSAAACLMSRYTGQPIEACVGRGTGLDDAGLARKRTILARALAHHPQKLSAIETLAAFGGFEIAAMTGAFIAAATHQMTIVVDGFVVTSALLAAIAIAPAVRDYCVFSHVSDEAGHRLMLEKLNAQPLLSLGLRLGEGTGAALAMPLLKAACAFMTDMASFTSAGVANRDDAEGEAPAAADAAAASSASTRAPNA